MSGSAAAAGGLLLIRHGRTVWNEQGRYQGRSDPPLSPAGAAEATALAQALAGTRLARVLASPLRRATETARLIVASQREGLELRIEPRLIEIGFGDWEGLTQTEVKARWPELLRRWKHDPAGMCFPGGGEALALAQARTLALLAECEAEAALADAPIALVTHTTIIRLAILARSGQPVSALRSIRVPPASAHLLEAGPGPVGESRVSGRALTAPG